MMDGFPRKRVADRIVSRRGTGSVLRDTASNRDHDAQSCTRIGCSGRLNPIKSNMSSRSEKLKSPSQPFRTASNRKELVGSSSGTYYAVRGSKKSVAESQRKLSAQLETDSSETSSLQEESEISHVSPSNKRIQIRNPVVFKGSDSTDVTMMEAGSSGVASNTRVRKDFNGRIGMRQKNVPTTTSVLIGSKGPSQTTRAGTGRHALRNLKCNLISDVVPSGCASLDSNCSKRKDVARKRTSEVESSYTRGKKINGSSLEKRTTSSSHGISISDSRGSKSITSHRENGLLQGRLRTSINGVSRARGHANRPDRNNKTLHESRAVISQLSQGHQHGSSIHNRGHDVSTETISSRPISFRRSDGNSERHSNRPASPAEVGLTHAFTPHDTLRHYGIAEVLLALERIEHDEELTYEQVILLESNIFLGGLNVYDQHRDMRLDIDNMSYEELLALEERMGNVSTALTEEALSHCVNRSTYQSDDTSAGADCSEVGDDVKCSICQEEYTKGDEVGTLKCEHTYHESCIQQWLRLKNWCPICKAYVETPTSSSLPTSSSSSSSSSLSLFSPTSLPS